MKEYLHKFSYHLKDNNIDHTFIEELFKIKKDRDNEIYQAPFYNVILNKTYRAQGWKIHISPFLSDYSDVLHIVIKKLVEEKVSFKFVPNLKDYMMLSDKNTPPSQFGKYITIYPKNDNEFKELNTYFYKHLVYKSGVRINGDKNYKDSTVISYRYGGLFPNLYMDSKADLTYRIFDGKGRLVEDQRNTYFYLPDGIKDIYSSSENSALDKIVVRGQKFNNQYRITNIVKRIGTGNVYQGIEVENGKKVIIKEARLGGVPTINEDKNRLWILKKNEYKLLSNRKISSMVHTPEPIDTFQNDNSFFIIESKIEGERLRNIMSQSPMLTKETDRVKIEKYDEKLKIVCSEILYIRVVLVKSF